jgi:hypothetical protein
MKKQNKISRGLAEGFVAGEPAAVSKMVKEHGSKLARIARRSIGTNRARRSQSDVVNDACLHALERGQKTTEREGGQVVTGPSAENDRVLPKTGSALMAEVVRNEARNGYRFDTRKKRDARKSSEGSAVNHVAKKLPTPSQKVVAGELQAKLAAALRVETQEDLSLYSRYRLLKSHSVAELATEHQITYEAMSKRLQRLVKRVAVRIDPTRAQSKRTEQKSVPVESKKLKQKKPKL